MDVYYWLAWLYWDPPREAFTMPFIDRPVMWYGILFVSGFILGYFILNPILVRFLKECRQLSTIDIVNWPRFIEELRHSKAPFLSQFMSQLSSTTCQQLQQSPTSVTSNLQQEILEGLNHLLKNSIVTRDELNQTFSQQALALPKQTAYFLTDRLCWFIVLGTVIGARLGLVFFYEWPYFRQHPAEIFKVWQGGLASHGGVIGVIISLYLYLKYIQKWVPQLTFLRLLDYVAVPSAIAICFIRLGNFMNQEILGIPTQMPWGIIFGHPADDPLVIPRHAVQLYEAAAYLSIFFILWFVWKKQSVKEQPGALVGLIFVLAFSSRFIIEFWKINQDSFIDFSFLQMGQLLSFPFVLLGVMLFWRAKFPYVCTKKIS